MRECQTVGENKGKKVFSCNIKKKDVASRACTKLWASGCAQASPPGGSQSSAESFLTAPLQWVSFAGRWIKYSLPLAFPGGHVAAIAQGSRCLGFFPYGLENSLDSFTNGLKKHQATQKKAIVGWTPPQVQSNGILDARQTDNQRKIWLNNQGKFFFHKVICVEDVF